MRNYGKNNGGKTMTVTVPMVPGWYGDMGIMVLQMKHHWLTADSRATVTKWAATWQNQQTECAPSEDSGQPGHPPTLFRVFAVRIMGS